MSVDGGVSSSSGQVLSVSEGNVLTITALVAFGQTEIDDVDSVLGGFSATNQEVVGFDVSMNNTFFMHNLDPLYHLDSNVEYCLKIEFSSAFLEQIFKRLTKQIHDHDVEHLSVLGFLVSDEVEVWNRSFPSQFMDKFGLPEEHDMLLVFDSFLDLGGEEVTCLLLLDLVEFSKSTPSELLDDLVPLIEDLLTFFHFD